MQLIRLSETFIQDLVDGRSNWPTGALSNTAISLGSFDGLHLGHHALIDRIKAVKLDRGLDHSCLFTFRDHPRSVLDTDHPQLICSWQEKLALLTKTGVDAVVVADFCTALAGMSHTEFVQRFLVDFLGMKHMVGGYDIHLGADRRGTADRLTELADALGFTFETVQALRDEHQDIVSSSAIRKALGLGDLDTATSMLGRHYTLWGEVGYGDGRGTDIGFPTANIEPHDPDKLVPAPGVYAVRVHLPADTIDQTQAGVLDTYTGALPETDSDGSLVGTLATDRVVLGGILNYGTAPTLHEGGLAQPRLEVHILDFSGYIRQRSVKLEWIRRIRDEEKFASVEDLQARLRQDEAEARRIFHESEGE
jgi:riboflavin kinase / FMN adenylyltransferase